MVALNFHTKSLNDGEESKMKRAPGGVKEGLKISGWPEIEARKGCPETPDSSTGIKRPQGEANPEPMAEEVAKWH